MQNFFLPLAKEFESFIELLFAPEVQICSGTLHFKGI